MSNTIDYMTYQNNVDIAYQTCYVHTVTVSTTVYIFEATTSWIAFDPTIATFMTFLQYTTDCI
jgi:hypothetical protein